MKTAKASLYVVTLNCPSCNEQLENPDSSSYMFGETDYPFEPTLECKECGKICKLPVVKFGKPIKEDKTQALKLKALNNKCLSAYTAYTEGEIDITAYQEACADREFFEASLG